jgi:hypothetical protein
VTAPPYCCLRALVSARTVLSARALVSARSGAPVRGALALGLPALARFDFVVFRR